MNVTLRILNVFVTRYNISHSRILRVIRLTVSRLEPCLFSIIWKINIPKWSERRIDCLFIYWTIIFFTNNFSALLLHKINVLDILNMVDYFQIFLILQSTEILMKSNFWLGMYESQLLCTKVQSYIFYQAFLNFTNSLWEKYVNQFWLPHKGRNLVCSFNLRLYKLIRLPYVIRIKNFSSM